MTNRLLLLVAVLVPATLFLAGCSAISPPTIAFEPTPVQALPPAPTAAPATMEAPLEFMRGVNYASWWQGEFASDGSDLTLGHVIRPMGVNWLAVVVTCYQETVTSLAIDCSSAKTASDADLQHVIAEAHRLGMRVMLKPHIDLSLDPNRWRGEIDLGSKDNDWALWFAQYRDFIGHYAALAERFEVDYLVVGTELTGTSYRDSDWREVVDTVRDIYSGPLTYAANHSGEEFAITWWDAVDAIGVDAYYSLASHNDPTVFELQTTWEPIADDLEALSTQYQRPVIFTEIGYQSLDGAVTHPVGVDGDIVDLAEQATAYEAVFAVFGDRPWWHGVFWWVWEPEDYHANPFDGDFLASRKPAEAVLREAYGAVAPDLPGDMTALPADETRLLPVYDNGLSEGWQDWSWDATVTAIGEDATGSTDGAALQVTLQPWGGLALYNAGVETRPYDWLEFYINVSEDETHRLKLFVDIDLQAGDAPVIELPHPYYLQDGQFTPGAWQLVRVPLAALGAERATLTRINVQDADGDGQDHFKVDGVRLIGAAVE